MIIGETFINIYLKIPHLLFEPYYLHLDTYNQLQHNQIYIFFIGTLQPKRSCISINFQITFIS